MQQLAASSEQALVPVQSDSPLEGKRGSSIEERGNFKRCGNKGKAVQAFRVN